MADQKPAPRPMYQPTPEELKNLLQQDGRHAQSRLLPSEHAKSCQTSTKISSSTSAPAGPCAASPTPTCWHPHRHHASSRRSATASATSRTRPSPTRRTSTCNQPQRPARFLRRQCKHTLAYMGYRTILAQHFERCSSSAALIKPAMYHGIKQPANALALNRFADWLPLYLADHVRVAAISAELRRPYETYQVKEHPHEGNNQDRHPPHLLRVTTAHRRQRPRPASPRTSCSPRAGETLTAMTTDNCRRHVDRRHRPGRRGRRNLPARQEAPGDRHQAARVRRRRHHGRHRALEGHHHLRHLPRHHQRHGPHVHAPLGDDGGPRRGARARSSRSRPRAWTG